MVVITSGPLGALRGTSPGEGDAENQTASKLSPKDKGTAALRGMLPYFKGAPVKNNPRFYAMVIHSDKRFKYMVNNVLFNRGIHAGINMDDTVKLQPFFPRCFSFAGIDSPGAFQGVDKK
jgi:hypothetical protein